MPSLCTVQPEDTRIRLNQVTSPGYPRYFYHRCQRSFTQRTSDAASAWVAKLKPLLNLPLAIDPLQMPSLYFAVGCDGETG
ncbi:MAG: hypothetical protein AAFY20_19730 [Cyanobacteria bacterium J06639_14]